MGDGYYECFIRGMEKVDKDWTYNGRTSIIKLVKILH